jgi:hypothetical protein
MLVVYDNAEIPGLSYLYLEDWRRKLGHWIFKCRSSS